MTAATGTASGRATGAGLVLLTLAAGQFLMTLDSSVMNVSIATVAEDVGTTVSGIQTAITAYTLVMATLMITGGKIGALIGSKRAFTIGCIIYGVGSFTTSIAPNLPILLLGWSFLEGVGAALIMPAIVSLVAGNFPTAAAPRRLRARGRCRRDGGRRRPADRRFRDDVLLLALGVRRRSRDRCGDPPARAAHCRRAISGEAEDRSRGRRPLGARARALRLRCAALGNLGLDLPQVRRTFLARALPRRVARRRRPVRLMDLLPLGKARRGPRRRASRSPGDASERPVARRPDDVLLPVPRPGRRLLRRPALPVRRARPVGARNGRPVAAAVRGPARDGDRDPEAASRTSRRGVSSNSASLPFWRARSSSSEVSSPTRDPRSSSCRCS